MTSSTKLALRFSLALTTVLAAPGALHAQATGSVRGTVTTATDKTPLINARVAIEQPALVAITDSRGVYVLRDLPAGTYQLVATALGREPARQQVTITGGQTQTLDIALKEGSLVLSSIVTTATRVPTEATKVASTVNVLTPELIATSPSRETQDLLREIPAVELKRQSSLIDGSAQIVSIRGVDEGRTMVTLDGVPIGDAWGEWIDWGRASKGALDRVEVISGGTSSLYGNGAIGGAISLFSRPMSPGSGIVTLDRGSRDARHGFVGAGVPIWGALSANVVGDYNEGGGYRLLDSVENRPSLLPGLVDTPNQAIQRNGLLRLQYAPSADFSTYVTGHRYGDTRRTGTALALTTRDFQEAEFGADIAKLMKGQLSLRGWDGRQLEHQRSSTVRTSAVTTACPTARSCEDSSLTADIPSHDWGVSAMWSRADLLGLESVAAGADYRHMQGAFSEVDFNTSCPGTNCGKVSRRIWSGGAQALSGAFVQAIVAPIDPLRIEISGRVDRWDNSDASAVDSASALGFQTHAYPSSQATAFSPRLGARYALPMPAMVGRLSMHAAVYKAFRAPNLAELYRKSVSATQITLPNPSLKDERALGREAGFDWQPKDWVELRGTYYVADYTNFNIPDTVENNATTPKPAECGTLACRQRKSISATRSEGGEAMLVLRPISALYIGAGVNYDDARQQSNLTAKQADSSCTTSGTTTTCVPCPEVCKPHINRVPSPRQTIRMTYSSRMFGSWTALWKHEGRTTTLSGLNLDPFTVLDANVQRDLVTGVLAFVSIENVADKKFQVNTSAATTTLPPTFFYGMPRTIRVGMTLSR